MANLEHLKILKQGAEIWNNWRKTNPKTQVDLVGIELPGCDLRSFDLSGALLGRSDLRDANFNNAHLNEADISDANLNGANFGRADLYQSKLSGSSMYEANFRRAYLAGADLSRCNLSKAELDGAYFYGANLKWAMLVGARGYGDLGEGLPAANLRVADLSEADLSEVNLCNASMQDAILYKANLSNAEFIGANLSNVDFREANIFNTDFYHADLTSADLRGAKIIGANLNNVNLVGAKINKAKISESSIYKINVWDLVGEFEDQKDLVIFRNGDPVITVDNIKIAQFIYLILNNKEIRDVINELTSKCVLILGRFSLPERKLVLDALRNKLREYNLLPIVFDFDRPTDKDFTETINTLAGLSFFVIADITNPRSSPLELQAIVPDHQIPYIPIIQEGEKPFDMMANLQTKYPWVLDTVSYNSLETLIDAIKPAIIDRAIEKHNELSLIKAKEPNIKSAKDFLSK